MLNIQSLDTVMPLAELMDRNNLVVLPVEGSPLAELVKATRTTEQFAVPVSGAAAGFGVATHDIAYMANTTNKATGICDHDVVQDELVEMIAKAVKGLLVVLRTGVKPAIVELHDCVTKHLSDLPTSSLLGIEVKVFDLPAPMKSPAIESLISKWEGTPFASPALRMRCPDVTMEQLVEIMKTGAAGLDGEVQKWIAVKGEAWFLQLWQDIFQTKNDRFDKFSKALECKEEGLDRAVAVFLIARKLVDDPVPDTPMSLPALRELAGEYRNQAATYIQRGLDDWQDVMRRKQIVRSWDDRCIIVNDNTYRSWVLERGGDNDILLGNLVTKSGLRNEDQLNEAAEALKLAWTRVLSRTSAADRTERFSLLKQILVTQFRKSVNDLKGDVDGPDASAGEREDVIKRFQTEVAKLNQSDCADLYQLCIRLICRSRFHKVPEAEPFFLQMMQIERDEQGIGAREASTIATIDYIACWVAEQFRVVPVGAR